MLYAFLTYRAPASHSRAASRSLAWSLVAVALLLASGPAVEAREYRRFEDVVLFRHPADARPWQTDGTPEGTRPFELVGERCFPEGEISGPAPGGTFFRCSTGLWFFDGASGKTVQLTGPDVGSKDLVWWEEGQRLFFMATGLWSGDLTTWARPIALVPSSLEGAVGTTEALWWLARERIRDHEGFVQYRYELWRTDGTHDGTFPTGIVLGTDGGRYSMSPLMPLGDFWIVELHNQFRQQFWSIDVSTGKAVLLAERTRPSEEIDREYPYVSDGRRVFFEFDDDSLGELQLWMTDGTVAGTRPFTDLAEDALSGPTFLTAGFLRRRRRGARPGALGHRRL